MPLVVSVPEELLVDLALDSPPVHPEATSPAGPTFSLDELAGRKLIALFDRAETRDFADVYTLATRFPKATLLERATEVDAGLDQAVLADMFATLARFHDDDLPIPVRQAHLLRRADCCRPKWRNQRTSDDTNEMARAKALLKKHCYSANPRMAA